MLLIKSSELPALCRFVKLRRSKKSKWFSSPAAERFFIGSQAKPAWSPTTGPAQAAEKHRWPDSRWKSVMIPGDFLICFEKSYCNSRIPCAIVSTVHTVRARYRELWYPTRTGHVRVEHRLLLCRLPPKSYRVLLLLQSGRRPSSGSSLYVLFKYSWHHTIDLSLNNSFHSGPAGNYQLILGRLKFLIKLSQETFCSCRTMMQILYLAAPPTADNSLSSPRHKCTRDLVTTFHLLSAQYDPAVRCFTHDCMSAARAWKIVVKVYDLFTTDCISTQRHC